MLGNNTHTLVNFFFNRTFLDGLLWTDLRDNFILMINKSSLSFITCVRTGWKRPYPRRSNQTPHWVATIKTSRSAHSISHPVKCRLTIWPHHSWSRDGRLDPSNRFVSSRHFRLFFKSSFFSRTQSRFLSWKSLCILLSKYFNVYWKWELIQHYFKSAAKI